MTKDQKQIIGYEDKYLINEDGTIKSVARRTNKYKNGKTHFVKERIKVATKHRAGKEPYYVINLTKDGKNKRFYVHRLIALHFIENKNGYSHVDHINRNTLDNRIENLRWVNHSVNVHNSNKYSKSLNARGVYKTKNRFRARISLNNKKMYLGSFVDIKDAMKAYDRKSEQLYGVNAITNKKLGLY